MKNSILFSIVFFFTVSFSFASVQSLSELLKMIKSRPLLVELPQINNNHIEKLKASGKILELNEYLVHYNRFLEDYKKAFIGNWTYNKEFFFKTFREMDEMTSKNPSNYAVIRFNESRFHPKLNFNPEYSEYVYEPENDSSNISSSEDLLFKKRSTLNLYLSEKQGLVLSCRLPVTESEAGVVFAIRQFDFVFDLFGKYPTRVGGVMGYEVFAHNYFEAELNILRINSSILYVKKEDLDKSFNIEKVEKFYKFKYKIVTNEEWEKAILEKNPNVICAILLPGNVNSKRYYHYFFCADNCKLIVNLPGILGIVDSDFKTLSKMAK